MSLFIHRTLKLQAYKPATGHLLYDSSLLLLTAAYSRSIRPRRKAD